MTHDVALVIALAAAFVAFLLVVDFHNLHDRILRLERREQVRSDLEQTAVNTLKHHEGEKGSGKLRG